jgi:sortase A
MTAVGSPHAGELDAEAPDMVLDLTAGEGQEEPAPTQTDKKRPRLSRVLPIVALAALGAMAVWFLLFAFVLTGFQEHANQTRLYDRFRLQLAEETAPLAEPVKAGAPVAMMNASSAGLHNVIVVEGTTSRLLRDGPGHLSDTPLPGQTGNPTLFGRSVTYGAPFGKVTGMKPGALLTVTTGQGVFRYRVEDVRVAGDRLPPLLKANQSRLTLVTSAGGGLSSGWEPTHTVYVDAMLVGGNAQPVPAGVPSTISRASEPMQGDPSGLVAFIFWFEALVAAVVLVSWSWARWGHAQTWIVGAPILLFVTWGTSDALMRFLPNLV